MVKLKVMADYQSSVGRYKKGATIEVGPAVADYLQRDAPGCFEVVRPKAAKRPPVDKMVRASVDK